VVQDEIEDDLHAPGVDLLDEPLAVGHRPVFRGNPVVVRDVVAEIALRARKERGEPERLDAEIL
jgi:hypothetical protein